MPSNPLPVHLPAECKKAQKILDSFANPHNGLDNVIPASVLRRAKGFCLLSVAKAGFLFSGRAGTGVVIARLEDGTWSAPSAVGTAGAGFGLQVGVELAEFLIILNSRAAVKSFMSAGSLTLGGNMSLAAGPLGRNVEGTGAISAKGGVAAMYSYSRTKGLFGGASVEGSIIVERSDANAKAYGQNVTAKQLLSGAVDPPNWAHPLISTISRLATPARSLPGGGWSTDSPLESPAPSTPADLAAEEDGYFSRARAQRRIEENAEQGLTPREYKERGYAFGSSYAAASSSDSPSLGAASPLKDKERGRFGAMLGSVGRSRSGSGSAAMSKKSSVGAGPAAGSSSTGYAGLGPPDDPFAGGVPASAVNVDGTGGDRTRFETRFDDEFDFSSAAAGRTSPSAAQGHSPSPSQDLMAFNDGDDEPPTSSRKDGALGSSRAGAARSPEQGRSRASSSASAGGSTSWFSKSSRPKLTKNRSSSAAGKGASSSGVRDRAGAMSWDAEPRSGGSDDEGGAWREFGAERGERRGSFDSLDDDFARAAPAPAHAPARARDRAATLANGFESRRAPPASALAAAGGGRTRAASSAAPGMGPGTYKPWDSEDESFLPPPPVIGRSRAGSAVSASGKQLDLRQVEADFATVMSLSRHGGDGEVGVASGVVPSPVRGRSRSGTGASAGGGIGKAVALFDFPGVEPTDLPFKKNDVITILARDDAEWWKGRLRLREGMIPRNYVEAHFE